MAPQHKQFILNFREVLNTTEHFKSKTGKEPILPLHVIFLVCMEAITTVLFSEQGLNLHLLVAVRRAHVVSHIRLLLVAFGIRIPVDRIEGRREALYGDTRNRRVSKRHPAKSRALSFSALRLNRTQAIVALADNKTAELPQSRAPSHFTSKLYLGISFDSLNVDQ